MKQAAFAFAIAILAVLIAAACGGPGETGPGPSDGEPRTEAGPGSTTAPGTTPGQTPQQVIPGTTATPPAGDADTPGQTPTPLPEFPAEAVDGDYDYDDDGLLEVRTLAQLHAMRLDPEGTGFVQEGRDDYFAAFPGTAGSSGCPDQSCTGYELAAHLDFDTNGNGEADAGDDYWNDGAGWEPLSNAEGVTFDGNGYTISNLFIRRVDVVGLFSSNYGTLQNIILAGADVTGGSDGTGGLVGVNIGTISNSSVSGDVSGIQSVGGLVGVNRDEVFGISISNSASAGTVSGKDDVGGLVGINLHTV